MTKYRFLGNPKMYNFKVKLRKGEEYRGDTVVLYGDITLEKLVKDSQKDVEENYRPFLEESKKFLKDWVKC